MKANWKVDHHLRAGHGVLEPIASDGVDARIRRSSKCVVTFLFQPRDDLGSDQPCSANNDDLHDLAPR